MAESWASIFSASELTPKAIMSGVVHFYAHDSTGDRPTPGKIISHARKAKEEWLQSPKGRAWLEARLKEAEQRRDEELANGTWRPGKGIYG